MTRRIRHRLRIALVVIFCLLFQQMALAAYLCPRGIPAKPVATSEHCAQMAMTQEKDIPALCQKHCNPDHAVAVDAVKVSVPLLALPALVFAPMVVPLVSHATMHAEVSIARSDPPPRLRFCSLLI